MEGNFLAFVPDYTLEGVIVLKRKMGSRLKMIDHLAE
jgi:hypothetical protein